MPVFDVRLPDGRVMEVQAPEGATREQAEAYVDSQLRIMEAQNRSRQASSDVYIPTAQTPEEEEVGFFGNLGGGFANGILGLYQQAAYGVASTLDKEAELAARKSIDETVQPLMFDTDEDSLTAAISGAIGSVAGALPLVAMGPTAAIAGGAALFGAAGAGEQSTRAIQAGASEEDKSKAEIQGALVGLLDILPIGRISKAFKLKAVDELTDKLSPKEIENLLDRAQNAGVTAGVEGVQEVISGTLQNVIEREYNPDADIFGGVAEEGALGATAGGTLQTIADLIRGRKTPATAAATASEPSIGEGEQLGLDLGVPEQPETDAERSAGLMSLLPEQAEPEAEPQRDDPAQLDLFEELERAEAIEAGRVEDEARLRATTGDLFPLEKLEAEQERSRLGEVEEVAVEPTAETPSTEVQPDLFETARQDEELARMLEQERIDTESADVMLEQEAVRQEREAQLAQDRADTEALSDLVAPARVGPTAEEQARLKERRGDVRAAVRAEDTQVNKNIAAEQKAQLAANKRINPKKRGQPQQLDMFALEKEQETRKLGKPTPQVEDTPTTPATDKAQISLFEGQEDIAPVIPPKEAVKFTPKADGSKVNKLGQTIKPTGRGKEVTLTDKDGTNQGTFTNQAQAVQQVRRQAVKANKDAGISTKPVAQPRVAPASVKAPVADVPMQTKAEELRQEAKEVRAQEAAKATDVGAKAYADTKAFEPTKDADKFVNKKTKQTLFKSGDKFVVQNDKKQIITVGDTKAKAIENAAVRAQTKVNKGQDPAVVDSREERLFKEQVERNLKGKRATKVEPQSATGAPVTKKTTTKKAKPAPKKKEAVSVNDKAKIVALGTETKLSTEGKAAQVYFGKNVSTGEAVKFIAHDIVNETKPFNKTGDIAPLDLVMLEGLDYKTATKAKEWVDANLSADTKKLLETEIKAQIGIKEAIAKNSAKVKAQENARADAEARLGRDIDRTYTKMNKARKERLALDLENEFNDETIDLMDKYGEEFGDLFYERVDLDPNYFAYVPHPAVDIMLKAGNLKGALQAVKLSVQGDKPLERLAQVMIDNVGDTTFEFQKGLTDAKGQPVGGAFSPKRNAVILNSDSLLDPIRIHMLMHEVGHAVTNRTLEDKNNPYTRAITKLYELTKDQFESEYARKSVSEFVAEAMSNPNFRQQLAQINFTDNGVRKNGLVNFLTNTINLFRKLVGAKALKGNALDAADDVINQMISPAPSNSDSGMLYAMSAMGRSRDVLTDAFDNIPMYTAKTRDRLNDLLSRGDLANKAKRAAMSLLPLNAIADLSKKYLPAAQKLDDIVQEQSGYVANQMQSVQVVGSKIAKWAKANKEEAQKLNNIIYKSTYLRIDPTKGLNYYKKADVKNNTDLAKDYPELKAEYNKLSPEAKEYYAQMRNQYKSFYLQIKDLLDNRLETSIPDEKARKSALDTLYSKLTDNGNIDPYFPLTRRGKFWLTYTGPDGELYKETFESNAERQRAVDTLKDIDGIKYINVYEKLDASLTKGAATPAFIAEVLGVLDKNKIKDEDVRNQMVDLFLTTIPEKSFLQGFRKRGDVRGFEGDTTYTRQDSNGDFKFDALDAFNSTGGNLVHQLSNMKYGAQIAEVQREMRENYAVIEQDGSIPQAEKARVKLLTEEINDRANFAKNPKVSKWAQIATSFGFGMTLGANISSALINFAQIPTVVAPYLGAQYGYKDTTAEIGKAIKLIGGSGTTQKVEVVSPDLDKDGKVQFKDEEVSELWGIDNYDFTDPNLPADIKKLQPLVEHASAMGQLNRSITYDVLDMDSANSPMTKINAVSGFVFHHAERANRQVALVASYNLALKDGKNPEDAAKEAVYVVELTNGGTAAGSAPRIAQNDIGKVAFLFKRYGVSMYYLLGKLANTAIRGSDADKKLARNQLIGIYGSTGLLAGVAGMPLFGTVMGVADLFLDDEEEDAESIVRSYLGGGVYRGALNATLGVDVASRISLSDLIFRMPRINRDQSALWTAIEAVGGPVIGVSLGMERGAKLIMEGEVQRGTEQLLPASLRNLLKAGRYSEEGALTLRRDPIMEDIGAGHIFAQALGFAPSEYIYQLERNAILKKVDRSIVEKRTKLLKKLYIAIRTGDTDERSQAIEDMREFNKRHRSVAITMDTIKRSLKQHNKTTSQMIGGVLPSSKRREEYIEAHKNLSN